MDQSYLPPTRRQFPSDRLLSALDRHVTQCNSTTWRTQVTRSVGRDQIPSSDLQSDRKWPPPLRRHKPRPTSKAHVISAANASSDAQESLEATNASCVPSINAHAPSSSDHRVADGPSDEGSQGTFPTRRLIPTMESILLLVCPTPPRNRMFASHMAVEPS